APGLVPWVRDSRGRDKTVTRGDVPRRGSVTLSFGATPGDTSNKRRKDDDNHNERSDGAADLGHPDRSPGPLVGRAEREFERGGGRRGQGGGGAGGADRAHRGVDQPRGVDEVARRAAATDPQDGKRSPFPGAAVPGVVLGGQETGVGFEGLPGRP